MAEEQQIPPENTADSASIRSTPVFQETEAAATEARVVDGITIPDWVNDGYLDSYVNSAKGGNPRNPNTRELTELQLGMTIEEYMTANNGEYPSEATSQASSMLYGVVGSNTDTRDWDAIIESAKTSTGYDPEKLTAATGIATSQMYGGTNVQFKLEKDTAGNDIPMAYITKGNGEILTSISGADNDFGILANFGVQGTDWIIPLKARFGSMGIPMTSQWASFFNKAETSYNPFKDYNDLVNQKFTTGLSQSKPITTGVGTTTGQTQTGTTTEQTGTGTDTATGTTITSDTLPQTVTYYNPTYNPLDLITQGQQQGSQQNVVADTTKTTTATTAKQPVYEARMYRNAAGMTMNVNFKDGKPEVAIPAGFYPVGKEQQVASNVMQTAQTSPVYKTINPTTGYTPQIKTTTTSQGAMHQGGMVNTITSTPQQNMFGGFKPESMQRIAGSLGYTGDMVGFNNYLNSNPDKKQQMDRYTEKAMEMANGGMVKKYQEGGLETGTTTTSLQQYMPRTLQQQYIPQQPELTGNIIQVQENLAKTPQLPTGATVVPVGTQVSADQLVNPYSGQIGGVMSLPTTLASTAQSTLPTQTSASKIAAIEGSPAIEQSLQQFQPTQLQQTPMITAQQTTESSINNLNAAQGTSIKMANPVQRQIEADPVTGQREIISPAANAQTAATYTEQVQAAEATPSKQATVQGQLEGLMQQFEGGETPAWAAGAMRKATETMIARGLGASSIAGQAIVQAAMEAALPIAQIDAQTRAGFEAQNLTNRQQRAMLAAQQRAQFMGMEFEQAFQARVTNAARIGDIANMNFTAEQQIGLENSRIANTANLANLSNSQAMVMAEAAALANLDMANLNNRQQAAVQNAQNFLQTNFTNLNTQQQTDLFKAQQRVQSLFTDQAALNASQQFNATSQNQVDQFFANLNSSASQFNAAQTNAQAQFNAGQANVIERFNGEVNNQRDQFNAQNRLVIDQANAQWRRQIATADTAAVNRANELNATSLLEYSTQAYNNLWQYFGDNMEWAWSSAENERTRINDLARTTVNANATLDSTKFTKEYESISAIGGLVTNLLTNDLSKTLAGSVFKDWL